MLRISFQTLRARRATLAGAFVAIWLAVTLAYAAGLLMAGALSAPGPGRFAAADAVVRADPTVTIGTAKMPRAIDAVPGPAAPRQCGRPRRGRARRRARRRRTSASPPAPGTRAGIACAQRAPSVSRATAGPSAALTPYAPDAAGARPRGRATSSPTRASACGSADRSGS